MPLNIDWDRLLSMAPLAFAKPGSPESMAFMQGQQESHERMRRDEERQRQAEERQHQMWVREQQAQAQAQNIEADNRRADESLELQRLQAYGRQDTGLLGALQKAPDEVLDPMATPLSAQNDLTVDRLTQQQTYGVPAGTPQGPLPNMTQAVSNRDKRLAQQMLDRITKNPLYAGYQDKPELDELSVQFKDGQTKKVRELRALAGGMLLGPDGTPVPPMPVAPPPAKAAAAGSFEEFVDADPARQTAIERARRRYEQADDRPRDTSGRDVTSAREAAYQAILAGNNLTIVARTLRRAGLDPEVELARVRRQVEADIRRVESQLPTDRYSEDRSDPAVFDARLARAREILRGRDGAGAIGGAAGTPPAASPSTMSRAELRAVAKRLGVSEAEAEQQARARGLTVVP